MTTTLYQRLGGADGIAKLVDDAMAAHLINPLVKTRFESIKDMDHAKQMARQFFGAGTGARRNTPFGLFRPACFTTKTASPTPGTS